MIWALGKLGSRGLVRPISELVLNRVSICTLFALLARIKNHFSHEFT